MRQDTTYFLLQLSLHGGETAERFGKARLAVHLMLINNLVPIALSVMSLIYANDIFRYTVCMGREEIFLHDLEHLLDDVGLPVWSYGRFISLPLYHPIRLVMNVVFLSFILVVPFAYISIYCFRKKHDSGVEGTGF